MPATPPWESARNGVSNDLNAVNHANQVNQLLGTHGINPVYEGNRVVVPADGTGFFQEFTGNGIDLAQTFTMSGTTTGRVSLPVFSTSTGSDFTVTLCPDSGGNPVTTNVLAQTMVPASWVNNLTNQFGTVGAGPLVIAQNQTMTGTQNITTGQAWGAITVDGTGTPLFNNSVCTNGNYFISAGGITTALSGAVFTSQFVGTGQLATPILQPSIPVPTYFGMLAANSNSLFFIGGNIASGGTTLTANTYTASWNPLTGIVGTWSLQAAIPLAVQHGSAATSGNTVYVVGGADQSDVVRAEVYYATVSNGQITTWNRAQNLPTPLQQSAVAVVNGWLVVAGGSTTSGSNTSTSLVYYAQILPDGSLGLWRSGPSLASAMYTWAPGWNFATTDSGMHIVGGTVTGGGAIFLVQSLSVTANAVGDYWKSQGFGSIGGAQMVTAFPMGNGKWNLITPHIGNPSSYAWSVLTPMPFMSVPLVATGLTNGATYHIMYQEHQYRTSSDFLSIGMSNGAYPVSAQSRTRGGSVWSTFSSGNSIPMVIYDNSVSANGLILHTWEDPTSTGSTAFSNMASRTTSMLYNSYNLPIGYCESTVLPNEPLNMNPTFTTGVTNWTAHNCTFVQSSAQVHGGFAFSGLMTPNGVASAPNVTSELVPIQQALVSFRPVQIYQINGWFYSPTGWGNVSLSVDWYDANQTYITTTNSTTTLAAATWTNLVMSYNPPSNAFYASINFIEATTPAAGNTVFFSNVFIVASPERTLAVAPVVQINYGSSGSNGVPWPPLGVTAFN
jgi:hypothetical protein